jgi:hypothetical protein
MPELDTPDMTHALSYQYSHSVRVRVSHSGDLGDTMKEIRAWLDRHKIQPASFRTTADPRGYLLTIDFHGEESAERFRQQFQEIVVADSLSKAD